MYIEGVNTQVVLDALIARIRSLETDVCCKDIQIEKLKKELAEAKGEKK